MKSTIKINAKKRCYPFLGISSSGMVVLFSEEGVGTVVHATSAHDYSIGNISRIFEMSYYRPFNGTVTFEN